MREYLSDIVIVRRSDQLIQLAGLIILTVAATLAVFVIVTGYAAPGSPMSGTVETVGYNPDATLDPSQVNDLR